MADFVFYYGNDRSIIQRIRDKSKLVWGNIKEEISDAFCVFMPAYGDGQQYSCSNDIAGSIAGYVNSSSELYSKCNQSTDRFNNLTGFFEETLRENGWPLSDDWTGIFSAVAFSKSSHQIALTNDIIGHIPLYYFAGAESLIGGTSIVIISSAFSLDVDCIGLLQRISPPYCNYGRRTIIKRLCRLMPGERILFSFPGPSSSSDFDNSLCKGVINNPVNDVAENVWNCIRTEVQNITSKYSTVRLALSGGWDSRLILSTLDPEDHEIICYTYGNDSLYETQIAKQCASLKKASHFSFPVEDHYIPPYSSLIEYVQRTEAACYLQWLAILERTKVESRVRPLLLTGDHCESIDGRNMRSLSSRRARKKSFINGMLGKMDDIPIMTNMAFDKWKSLTRDQAIKMVTTSFSRLNPDIVTFPLNVMVDEVSNDLELCFDRIKGNMPEFEPMLDELFAWHHKTRFKTAGQDRFLCHNFRALSPGLAIRVIRLISRIHPRLRIRRRLMDAISRLPQLSGLSKIPSAQIPWVGAHYPSVLRECIWGARSGIDQFLIRRMLKTRNHQARQRVLQSFNLVAEYNKPDSLSNIKGWFSGNWIQGEAYAETALRRAKLLGWPLAIFDISIPANVSITLDLCFGTSPTIAGTEI